jgi:hypothetical protein
MSAPARRHDAGEIRQGRVPAHPSTASAVISSIVPLLARGSLSRATGAGGFLVSPSFVPVPPSLRAHQITDGAPSTVFVNRRLEARADGSEPISWTTFWSNARKPLGRSLQPCLPLIRCPSPSSPFLSRRSLGSTSSSHDAFFNRGVTFCPMNRAPFGGSPVSRYFHNAINRFRAKATIPTFRSRQFPLPKRRRYHRLNSLVG